LSLPAERPSKSSESSNEFVRICLGEFNEFARPPARKSAEMIRIELQLGCELPYEEFRGRISPIVLDVVYVLPGDTLAVFSFDSRGQFPLTDVFVFAGLYDRFSEARSH
jgi:hypothetical protein